MIQVKQNNYIALFNTCFICCLNNTGVHCYAFSYGKVSQEYRHCSPTMSPTIISKYWEILYISVTLPWKICIIRFRTGSAPRDVMKC